MLQRRLITLKGRVDILSLAKKDLFRVAVEVGLITDPVPWFEFHEARKLSSHTYDDKIIPEKVMPHVLDFQPALHHLLEKLEQPE